jgi:7-carboxy-7-deazaguanine synthase
MITPDSLRITEIFHSLQGEARSVGIPTVFVRLTCCPLRCQYCDTAYAFEGGIQHALPDIVQTVKEFDCDYVTVTGGEPLAQPNCLPLLSLLCDQGLQVSLETGGAMPIDAVDERVSVVLDLKTPGSDEVGRNRLQNIALLKPKDQVKFVICDRKDYEWSRSKLLEYNLAERAGEVLFSPSHEQLSACDLAEWILEDRLRVRLQLQLHKILWGAEQGR